MSHKLYQPVRWGTIILVGMLLASPVSAQSGPAVAIGTVQCLIQPHSIINLGSPVEGFLDKVSVDRGDRVTKGQVVANLESGVEEATAELARARAKADVKVKAGQARLQYQQRRLNRNERLHKKKVVSFSTIDESRTEKTISALDLQEAKFNLRLAGLELKRAQEVLKRRTIRSPMDGIVVERFLSPGEYVNEQAPLLKLARVDLLKVEAFMQIAQYGNIRAGMRAEVFPQKPIGGRYVAEVTVVDKLLDAASGTFRVRLSLPNKDLLLPAGVRCQLKFIDQ